MDQALSSTTRAKDCLAGAGLLLSPNQNADQISGDFDRWREAIHIIQRLREAGISCELFNDLQNGN